MELRQLDYFVAVVEEANFTRAAARVHVAQPAVSAQIRRLERELGQDLLDRTARVVRLTAAGAAVLPYARAALAAVAAVRTAVEQLTGLLRGHLSIGTVTFQSERLDLPGLLAGFHRDHPAVQMTLAVAGSDQLLHALHTGHHDLAFVGLGAALPPEIDTHVLIDEPLLAVVPAEHPLAALRTVELRTLAEHPLISLPRGTGLRACLDAACAASGIAAHVTYEAAEPRMAAQLAAHGFGVAIVPAGVATARSPQLHALTITDRPLRARLAAAWRAAGPTSPAARALINHVRTETTAAPDGGTPAGTSPPARRALGPR